MLIIFGLLFYLSHHKGIWERLFRDFRDTVDEAYFVKDDLNEIMEKSLEVSQSMVDAIDQKIAEVSEWQCAAKPCPSTGGEEKPSPPLREQLRPQPIAAVPVREKIRVYELAREFNMSSKTMLKQIQALGYPVMNQLNTLDSNTANEIRRALAQGAVSPLPAASAGNDQAADREKQELSIEEKILARLKTGELSNNEFLEELRNAHPYLAVRTLQERGYSIREMAQMLDRGQGEISLILNIISKKRA